MAATGHTDHGPASLEWHGVPSGQAADETGLSSRTVRRLAAAGLITARRVGARAWLVDVASVHDYLKGNRVTDQENTAVEPVDVEQLHEQRQARRAEAGIPQGNEPTREERRTAHVAEIHAQTTEQDGDAA